MTSALLQPDESVKAAVRQRWPERADQWLTAIGSELRELCDRYHAQPVKVLPARYGFVVATATATGMQLVMRASADPAGRAQAEVAIALARIGAGPAVHEVTETDAGTWMVLDQVMPGTPLRELDFTGSTIDRIVAMLRRLVDQPAPSPHLPLLSDWLRDRLTSDDATDLAPGQTIAPADERRLAVAILDDLAPTAARHGLCHGDASPGNILLGPDERLYLVDARGVLGEPAYDAAVLANKACEDMGPHHAGSLLAERVGLDSARVQAWITVANAARV